MVFEKGDTSGTRMHMAATMQGCKGIKVALELLGTVGDDPPIF